MESATSIAFFTESTVTFGGSGSLISCNNCRKSSLSSAFCIASICVPSSRTLYFSRIPDSESSTAKFKPVCPPRVANKPSGRSMSIIFSKNSFVNGSI